MLNVVKFYRRSYRHLAHQITGLASLMAIVLAGLPAQASVTLTRAEVEALRNRVEFIPQGRPARAARMSDFLARGDALRTAASSQADLRFNDGSLARVGERATFRFVPNTRNFRLTNGTVLLLIPPGQGRTNIQTPSAVTGIQGSAVVVRYVPESDLTLVMALTNNPAGPMTITTSSCGEGVADCGATEYALYGGQMALIQNNQVQVVEFDLPTFYQTSPLVEGLELDNPNVESPLGPALESVRKETLETLEGQTAFEGGVQLPPGLISLDGNQPDTPPGLPDTPLGPRDTPPEPPDTPLGPRDTPPGLPDTPLGPWDTPPDPPDNPPEPPDNPPEPPDNPPEPPDNPPEPPDNPPGPPDNPPGLDDRPGSANPPPFTGTGPDVPATPPPFFPNQ